MFRCCFIESSNALTARIETCKKRHCYNPRQEQREPDSFALAVGNNSVVFKVKLMMVFKINCANCESNCIDEKENPFATQFHEHQRVIKHHKERF